MTANRQHKDSVFSLLFGNPEMLRELYFALEGVPLDESVPVTINTLEGALFNDRINDISFEVGGRLVVLIEHQSTINPNMAIRLLLYIARIYEKTLDSKNIYSSKRITIPHPQFFVLYNGTAPYPAEAVLRLSDSFEDISGLGLPSSLAPELELTAKVININSGYNEDVFQKSRTLTGYCIFINKVREFQAEKGNLEEAMRLAIRYCIEHNILRQFFEANDTEVCNMLMTEWNWNDALEVRWEEGIEEGMEKGREEGRKNALIDLSNLLKEGKTVDEALNILNAGE